MMNIPESMAESSSKRQENGDGPPGSERPLKKARFAWQVKGKYHLKNDSNDTKNSISKFSNESSTAGTSSDAENVSRDLIGSTEQNLEILGDYLLKQDFNTIDSVIADSEKSLLKPVCLQKVDSLSSMSTERIEYPRYVSSYDNNVLGKQSSSVSSSDHVPIHMSLIQEYSENQCIARWQAKQMAKGFVDNTINRVLDSWSRPPPLPEMDQSRFLAMDIAEFINNMPDYDNSVENEGILMAISAHGLQNTSASSSHAEPDEQTSFPESKEKTFLSPPSSPLPPEDELIEPLHDKQSVTERRSSTDSLWPYSDVTKPDTSNEYSIFDSSSSYQYYNENDSLQTDNADYSNGEMAGSHFDFMDTAVSFAILNKGLTTFGNEYG